MSNEKEKTSSVFAVISEGDLAGDAKETAVLFTDGKRHKKTNKPRKVSFDGGITYFAFEDIPADILAELEFPIHWGQVTYYMEPETAEKVNAELAPCSAADFLKRYLELAAEDLTAVYVAGLY